MLPPLRWAADAEGGAPYIFKDADDPRRNIGFEVDLANGLGEGVGPADRVRPVRLRRPRSPACSGATSISP